MKGQKRKYKDGALYKRGKTWWCKYYVDGKRFYESLKTTDKKEAKRLMEKKLSPLRAKDEVERKQILYNRLKNAEEHLEEAKEWAREKLALEDTWNAYLKSSNRPDTGAATLRQYSFQWNRFQKWALGRDLVLLMDITPDIAADYALELRDEYAAGTYNKHVNLLKLVFKTLGDAENLPGNPFANIQRRKDSQNHRKELSWDKLSEICDAAEGELKTLLFIGIYTGLRLGDCCTLTWDEVDLMRGWITRENSKTKRITKTVIHDQLRPMFEKIPPKDRRGFVLPEMAVTYLKPVSKQGSDKGRTRADGSGKGADLITRKIQKLFTDCGVQVHKPGTGPGTGVRAVVQYGFHSLRHTFVSMLKQSGVSQSVAMELVGHTSIAMSQRYTHTGEEAIKSAVSSLPALGAPQESSKKDLIQKISNLLPTSTVKQQQAILAILTNRSH